jgi:hypothetical protein
LLALLAHDFFHASRIRVKSLTLRLLMSYIYIYIYIYDISHLRVNAGGSFVWYESSTLSFSSTNAYESFHTNFKALVDSALPNVFLQETAQEKTQNKTYTKMQGDNTRRLKNQQPSKKVSKIG